MKVNRPEDVAEQLFLEGRPLSRLGAGVIFGLLEQLKGRRTPEQQARLDHEELEHNKPLAWDEGTR